MTVAVALAPSIVTGSPPNRAAVIRLVGAVLAEQNDEWAGPPLHVAGAADQARTTLVDGGVDDQVSIQQELARVG